MAESNQHSTKFSSSSSPAKPRRSKRRGAQAETITLIFAGRSEVRAGTYLQLLEIQASLLLRTLTRTGTLSHKHASHSLSPQPTAPPPRRIRHPGGGGHCDKENKLPKAEREQTGSVLRVTRTWSFTAPVYSTFCSQTRTTSEPQLRFSSVFPDSYTLQMSPWQPYNNCWAGRSFHLRYILPGI